MQEFVIRPWMAWLGSDLQNLQAQVSPRSEATQSCNKHLSRTFCERALRTMNAPVGPAPKMTACGCDGGGKLSSSLSSGRRSLRSSPVA